MLNFLCVVSYWILLYVLKTSYLLLFLSPLQILNSNNSLSISCQGELISTYIVNLLGKTIISKTDRDMISFDLTSFANGLYFAIITSGDQKVVRKLTVVH